MMLAVSPTMTLKNTFANHHVTELSLHPSALAEGSPPPSSASCSNCVIANITVNTGPAGIAYDNQNGDVYVADEGGGLWGINGSTNSVIASPGAGNDPFDVAYDPVNGYLYVVDQGSDSVMVFNGSTNTAVVSSIPVVSIPQCDAYDPADGDIYVAGNGAPSISVINATSNTVTATISMQSGFHPEGPQCITYDNQYREVYVADQNHGVIWIIQGSVVSGQLAMLPVAWGIGYDSLNNEVYVTGVNGNAVYAINPNGGKVTTIGVSGWPDEVAIDTDNGYAYVTDQNSNNVTVIDGATNKVVIPSISMPNIPTGIGYDWSNNEIYVSRWGGDKVAVIATSATPVTLTSVTVTPPSASLPTGGSATFVATPGCSGGTCPAGTTFSWFTSSALGKLNTTTGSGVTFTANNVTGGDTLFVNASLNGITKQAGPVPINITTSVPTLASVSVTPTSVSIPAGTTQNFSATPTCSGGPCPSGTSYVWTLNNSLGSVNPTTGASTTFTAGPTAGSIALKVTATLNGISKQSVAPVTITASSVLTSVTVTPSSPSVTVNGTQGFTATPTCTSMCPGNVAYLWTLNNTLGSVNPTTGSTTTFTAGLTAGAVRLTVTASLNGVTKLANATVTIAPTVPVLSSVSVSPTSITTGVGNSTSFTAHPNCTGGACPSGATYSWALNNTAMGSLSPTTGATETFTAGTTAGSVILYATAYLNGHQATGLAIISITKGIVPTLTGLTLTPSPTALVQVGKSMTFNATPSCSVSPCPSGIVYTWVLNNTLGNLSSTSGLSVVFTAGTSAGATSLTVTAQLNSGSKTATSDVTISSSAVPVITGVTITPGSATVQVNQGQRFTANATCSPGPCPSSTTYTWTLNNSLGNMSPSTGTSTQFTAGSSSGSVTLRVNATFNGKTVISSVVITISQQPTVPPTHSASPSSFLGLPGYDGYILLVAIVAAVAVALVVTLKRRKKTEVNPSPSTGYQGYPESPGYSQQYQYPPGQ